MFSDIPAGDGKLLSFFNGVVPNSTVVVPLTVLKVQMMPAKRTMMRKENKKAARPALKSLYLTSSKPAFSTTTNNNMHHLCICMAKPFDIFVHK